MYSAHHIVSPLPWSEITRWPDIHGTFPVVKSIIESGEIGRVMSSTFTVRIYRETFLWGLYVSENAAYTADAESGATLLELGVGHFIDSFSFILGEFSTVSAVTDVQYPIAELVDAAGKPTGKTVQQTGPNQIALSGKLQGGAVVSLHWRGGMETRTGKAGTPFLWLIDGEKGSIRLESDEAGGCFIQLQDPTLYLNGDEVKLEGDDKQTNAGRAWAEFAKGRAGQYVTLNEAVKVKRILDAISRSSKDGRAIKL